METLILFLLSKGAKLWHENEMNFDELKFDELKNSDERWTFFVQSIISMISEFF